MTNRCDIVGIDVGGTNTDAVLVRGESVIAAAKTPTNPDNLLESTRIAYEQVAKEHDGANPIELHLSTTLSTNAIIEGTGRPCSRPGRAGPRNVL
ncbi:MAG: hydantoinase/oxoprolinase N-terminal domain-containing protein [Bacillota bacterium]